MSSIYKSNYENSSSLSLSKNVNSPALIIQEAEFLQLRIEFEKVLDEYLAKLMSMSEEDLSGISKWTWMTLMHVYRVARSIVSPEAVKVRLTFRVN